MENEEDGDFNDVNDFVDNDLDFEPEIDDENDNIEDRIDYEYHIKNIEKLENDLLFCV